MVNRSTGNDTFNTIPTPSTYGIVRFLIEFVRVPDAQLGYLLGGVITMGQLLSLPLVIVGLALVIFALRRNRPQRVYLDA